jgi:hypothetical protein
MSVTTAENPYRSNQILAENKALVDFGDMQGHIYYAVQATESYYAAFYADHFQTYSDGTVSIYNTIQEALDASARDRSDTVIIMGGWTITAPLSVDRKYGLRIIGENPFHTYTGGCAEITYNGTVAAFQISSAKVWISDLTVYMGGTGAITAFDISGRVFSHGVMKNINIRKTAGTDAQGHAITAGSPSSSTFENIKISAEVGKRWQTGILFTGDDKCNYKNLVIGGTEGFCIYNPGSTMSVYDEIIAMPSCEDGFYVTGLTSVIINSRIMSVAPGTSTAIISGSYTTGLSAYTGT